MIEGDVIETYVYKLNDGNPNVNDAKSNLNNSLLNQVNFAVNINYDK
jgi:hypothetical protein